MTFLDVEFEDSVLTGLDIAKEIRTHNPFTFLIFVTNYSEYQKYVFNMHTFDYVVKPFREADILRILNDLLTFIQSKTIIGTRELFKIVDGSIISINVDDILYFEYKNRHVDIVTIEKSYSMYTKLSDIAEKMYQYNFFQCHKSFVINLRTVKKFSRGRYEITMINDDIVPISKLRAKEFKEKYLNLSFNREV